MESKTPDQSCVCPIESTKPERTNMTVKEYLSTVSPSLQEWHKDCELFKDRLDEEVDEAKKLEVNAELSNLRPTKI